ncbi:hypothetical protein ACTG9Q_02885 [Actinokineospora sp. 24-640]
MSVNVTVDPGPRAAAGFMGVGGAPALVLFLDPGNVVIQVPPFPGGARFLAMFCRQLSREARKLADALETPGAQAGRHALIPDDQGGR